MPLQYSDEFGYSEAGTPADYAAAPPAPKQYSDEFGYSEAAAPAPAPAPKPPAPKPPAPITGVINSSAGIAPPPAAAPAASAPSGPPPVSLQYPAAPTQEYNPVTPMPQNKGPSVAPAPNPYADAEAPKVDTGLIGGAMTPPPQVTGSNTSSNVALVDPSTVTGGVASTYDPTVWSVGREQTVEGTLDDMIKSDNYGMQQATTRASQEMAKRGLINSSMGVGAAEAARYNAGIDIAKQDASTRASASQFNAGASNRASEFGASAKNALQSQNLDNTAKAELTNAAAKNESTKFDAQTGMQAQLSNQDVAAKQLMQQYDTVSKVAFQNADAAGKLQLQQIDAHTRTSMAQIEADFKTRMQTSQSLAQSYQSMVEQVTKIMSNNEMNADAKQASIDNLTTLYRNAMDIQSDVTGIGIGTLLAPGQFEAIPGGNKSKGTPALTPEQAGAPGNSTDFDSPGG